MELKLRVQYGLWSPSGSSKLSVDLSNGFKNQQSRFHLCMWILLLLNLQPGAIRIWNILETAGRANDCYRLSDRILRSKVGYSSRPLL